MAGVTNSAFRTIAKSSELDLLSWKWSLTRESNTTTKNPAHASILMKEKTQFLSNFLVAMKIASARAAEFIQENTKTDIVDINMGCPVNKIVKNEAGAMWLKDPDKIYSIINKVQSVLDIPLTVKCVQAGLDPSLAWKMLSLLKLQVFLPSPCMAAYP